MSVMKKKIELDDKDMPNGCDSMVSSSFDGAIFDLDGVVTHTAKLHAEAWETTLNEYLLFRRQIFAEPFAPFTTKDYLAYVDGKPRYQGAKSFLGARGIHLPSGHFEDAPNFDSICGLGNLKNTRFQSLLQARGAEIFKTSVTFIRQLKQAGIHVAIASSSKNCTMILQKAGLQHLFEVQVDGLVSEKLGLKGKPQPDIFQHAAMLIGVSPGRSMVVEDAVSGVMAGHRGGFGLVLGIARACNTDELLAHGADLVVSDLDEITIDQVNTHFRKP